MIQHLRLSGFLLAISLLLSGCYSFNTATIDYSTTRNFTVEQFGNNARNALPSLAQQLTEDLKDKIRLTSRLNQVDPTEQADIRFKGTLVDYRITAEAPTTGESVAISRLTINLAIEYINNNKKDSNWKRNFSFFYDFDATTDFSEVEEEAISTISDQLMEDIFNAAFSDW